jgi:hypothetical protein
MQENSTAFFRHVKLLTERYSVILIFLLVSIATVSKHLFFGFPAGHSVNFNIFWQQYFTEQLLTGEIYPRWLFNYLDGFGAPVFYFYAPLPFYLFSLIEVIFGHDGEGFTTLTIGHMMIFFLSSVAFYSFISRYTDKFWATITSILYLLIPYHYIDLEVRATVGESLAYVWIPLIMIGLCHPQKTWIQLFFSGFCYAGLILSHLPSALLSALAIAIFSVGINKNTRFIYAVGYALFVGIVGIAVSAFYILPAILLQDTLPYDAWVTSSGPHYQAVNWLIGRSGIPEFGILVYNALALTSLLSVGIALVFGTIFYMTKPSIEVDEVIWRLIVACLLSLIVCWLLMTNLSQFIWAHFSLIAKVQFPWRLGIIIDFCSVLLISLTIPRILAYFLSLKSKRLAIIEQVTIVIALVIIAIVVIVKYFPQTDTIASRDKVQLWPIEYRTKWLVESEVYLPTGNAEDFTDINLAYKIHQVGFLRWRQFVEPLPPIASLRVLAPDEVVTRDEKKPGNTLIFATLKSPATIRVKKFYYPHWRLTDNTGKDFAVYADIQTGLLLFDLPAGKYELTLDRQLLPSEQIGLLISFISIGISFIWMIAFGRLRSRRMDKAPAAIHLPGKIHHTEGV